MCLPKLKIRRMMKMFRIVFVGVVAVFSLQVGFAQDYEELPRIRVSYTIEEIYEPLYEVKEREAIRLTEFFSENVRYPAVARENGTQGTVHASYIIERDGSITNVEVISSPDPSLSREVMRNIINASRTTPREVKRFVGGRQGTSRYVRTRQEIKVHFALTTTILTYLDGVRTDSVRYNPKCVKIVSDSLIINIKVHEYHTIRRRMMTARIVEVSRPTFWQRITRIFR